MRERCRPIAICSMVGGEREGSSRLRREQVYVRSSAVVGRVDNNTLLASDRDFLGVTESDLRTEVMTFDFRVCRAVEEKDSAIENEESAGNFSDSSPALTDFDSDEESDLRGIDDIGECRR